jgi:hypothetical protein
MITAREAAYAIYGAWRLARFDAGGVQFFDNTVEAFWRSFYAALIALPGYGLLVLLRVAGTTDAGAPPMTVLVVESISYAAGWFAFPLAMFYVARTFDLTASYFRYIAAYNWAIVLQVTLLLGVTAVTASLPLAPGVVQLVFLVASFAILAYQWFIARATLGIAAGAAAGIVALDLVLGLLINGYAARILMAAAQG